MDTADKIQLTISYAIRLTLVFAIVTSIVDKQWMTLFIASLVLFLTFLPAILQRNTKMYLPIELEFVVIIFIYATLYLGEVHSYYALFWWWDVLLHIGSAIALGIIGFLIVYILNYDPKVKLNLSPVFVAIFSFTFALAIGTLWEITEFFIDMSLGTNMLKSGLVDTMWDLIVDALGAVLASALGYLYVVKGDFLLMTRLTKKLVDRNQHLFK
ncbi:hypothetical protein ACFL1B_05300 [Nanoarchaeota archaeon]